MCHFSYEKGSSKSIQFQPKLNINNKPVAPIKKDESFRYLGRHFDVSMSNMKHKLEIVYVLESLMSDTDKLLITRKQIAPLS